MSEQTIEFRTPDGVVDGFFYAPPSGTGPGVIHLTDIGGVRPATRELAARVAAEGFAVLHPNLFYRTGRTPLWDFPMVWGEDRTAKRFAELVRPLTPDAVERDASAFTQQLAGLSGVKAGGVGVVGYCFTGAVALRMAATVPDRIAAIASFHGGGLLNDSPTSPHLVLPRVKAGAYFGHASEDRSMPADAIQKFEAALAARGGTYQSETYPARHGWTMPGGAYSKPDAERAFGKLVELLKTLR